MPSILRTAAVAVFAVFASAQFSNSTTPTAISVPGWKYDGCFSVFANTGSLVESSVYMTVERCLLDCSAYPFARINGNNCYCATSTNGTAQVADSLCSKKCPGNPSEACGGPLPGAKRQATIGVASVYEQLAVVPFGVVYTTVITNIYIDICLSCIGGTAPVTYLSTVTLTGCGCPTPVIPTIPLTTTVTTCPISGTPTTLTLTVPSGVTPGTATGTITAPVTTVTACPTCPGGSTTLTVSPCPGCATATVPVVAPLTTKAVYTGAAGAVKAGSGLLAGAIAVAAML